MPITTKPYRMFNNRLRDKLEALYNAGVSAKKIADQLGFTFQSIYRELKRGFYMHRNTDWTETKKYSAYKAQRNADYRSTAKGAPLKIGKDKKYAEFIEGMILSGYSPSAILDYIKENNLEFETKVCRVTIYSYIDKGVFLNISNKDLLLKSKKKKKCKADKTAKQLPKENSIEKRPKEVASRLTFGHWELDSVIGTKLKDETVLAFTERKTRMELIFKSPNKTAASTVMILDSIERELGSSVFQSIFKTITCDNGTEFSNTLGMETSPFTGVKRTTVYYCHPYCSSERGSNENQNGFIRRFIPKGTRISSVSSERISHIQNFINSYPRRIFNGQNSLKLFKNELKKLNIKFFLNKIHSNT